MATITISCYISTNNKTKFIMVLNFCKRKSTRKSRTVVWNVQVRRIVSTVVGPVRRVYHTNSSSYCQRLWRLSQDWDTDCLWSLANLYYCWDFVDHYPVTVFRATFFFMFPKISMRTFIRNFNIVGDTVLGHSSSMSVSYFFLVHVTWYLPVLCLRIDVCILLSDAILCA